VLKNTLRTGVVNKTAFPHQSFSHGCLAPGAVTIGDIRRRMGIGSGGGSGHHAGHSQKRVRGLSMRKSRYLTDVMIGMVLTAVLFIPSWGWAHHNDEDDPRLTVSAEGKIDVPPDKGILSFAVETIGNELQEVQKENQERMAKVKNACQTLGIPPQRIQTTSLNVVPQYPKPPRRPSDQIVESTIPRIIGYRIVHQVNVEVHHLEIVGDVVDRVIKAGANRFSGVSWGIQNEQPVKLRVLQQASEKAQAKAATLAKSLNLTLGRLMKVTEGGVSVIAPDREYRRAGVAMATMGSGDPLISAGEITVRGTVGLVYEIIQP